MVYRQSSSCYRSRLGYWLSLCSEIRSGRGQRNRRRPCCRRRQRDGTPDSRGRRGGDVGQNRCLQASEVEALVRQTVEIYGQLNYAHNNAGIGAGGIPIIELSERDFDRTIAVNLKGVWLCLKYEIIQILKQGTGSISMHSNAS